MGRGVKQSTSRELSGGFLEYISLHNSTPCRGLLLSDKLVKTWSWRTLFLAAATFGGGEGLAAMYVCS